MPRSDDILVIGYGNELRGDDAAGPRVVASLPPDVCHQVTRLIQQQLTPELAEPVSRSRGVIFVDASVGCTRLEIRSLQPRFESDRIGHDCNPSALLALATALFGQCPPAWLVAIPAESFELGAAISPTTEASLLPAQAAIQSLCTRLDRP